MSLSPGLAWPIIVIVLLYLSDLRQSIEKQVGRLVLTGTYWDQDYVGPRTQKELNSKYFSKGIILLLPGNWQGVDQLIQESECSCNERQ